MSRDIKENYIIKQFTAEFNEQPAFIVRAPGRVNLIGEHTDYNGLPVMPIAIPYTIKVAVSLRTDNRVYIKNTDYRFKPSSFDISGDIPVSEAGDWSNYVKAAVNELSRRYKTEFKGMNALYYGDLPSSAGLSSSSALVIASALSFIAANGQRIDPVELAEAMAYGEHYVGTQGGGMDQAICMLGRKNNAVKLDFFPLRHQYVPFPENHSIVVAHSLVRAAKTENALLSYNRRPAECRLATAIINATHHPAIPLKRLGDCCIDNGFDIGDSYLDFVDQTFPEKSYSLEDVASITGETCESVTKNYLYTRSGVPMPVPPEGFLIRQRALHVLSEAHRVEESVQVMENGDAKSFGILMNRSHKSCDELYGISTPELNTLVGVMRDYGALGARLTGAGFGGCAIGLVRDDDVAKVMNGVREAYYKTYIRSKRPDLMASDEFDDSLLFSVKPADGASYDKV